MSDTQEFSKHEKSIICYVRGFPFPTGIFAPKNPEEILDYVPRDGDVIITAYPKTGNNWLQYIILLITSKGEQYPSMEEALFKVVPYMDITGIQAVEALEEPRIYRTHIPYNLLKINEKAKYITMYRNPADTLVSYFHFYQDVRKAINSAPLNFEQYFEDFISGNIAYGQYFEHVLSYYTHRNDPNLLFLSYEKLLADRRNGILKIAEFLGEEYAKELRNNESLLEKIVEQTSFEYMKKNLSVNVPVPRKEGEAPKKLNFFRKGTKGDGKSSLSDNQMKRMRDVIEKVMNGTDVAKEWLADLQISS